MSWVGGNSRVRLNIDCNFLSEKKKKILLASLKVLHPNRDSTEKAKGGSATFAEDL